MEIIIEEISKGHKLIGRHKFAQNDITIGRGYHSDIILSDPHVCAEHLSISFDGEHWHIKDLHSINGSFIGESKQRASGHIVHSGDVITLGKSQIRIVFPHHPVSESITLSSFENLINLTKHPISLLFNIAFFACITGWLFFLSNPKDVNITQVIVPALSLTLMFAVWPLIVALISHLTKHDARVWTQLGVCFVFYNLTWATDLIENIVLFNTSSNSILAPLVTLLPIALAFCLFWLNGYIGFHMTHSRKILLASCLTVLLFGGNYLVKLSKKPEFSAKPTFNSVLMTPGFLFASSSNVEDFVANSNKLFEKADKAAQEK